MVGAYGTYGKKKNAYGVSVGKPKRNKEINLLKNLCEYGRISKWIAKENKRREDVDSIILAEDRDSCKHATRTLDSRQ
jgi:hypothetical protein